MYFSVKEKNGSPKKLFLQCHFFECKTTLSVVLHCAIILYYIFLLFKIMVPEKLSFVRVINCSHEKGDPYVFFLFSTVSTLLFFKLL